jgi:hypothetical protein
MMRLARKAALLVPFCLFTSTATALRRVRVGAVDAGRVRGFGFVDEKLWAADYILTTSCEREPRVPKEAA